MEEYGLGCEGIGVILGFVGSRREVYIFYRVFSKI